MSAPHPQQAFSDQIRNAAFGAAQGAQQAMGFMAPAMGGIGQGINLGMQYLLDPHLTTPAQPSQDIRNGFVNQIAQASPEMYNQNIPLHASPPPQQAVLADATQAPVSPTPTPTQNPVMQVIHPGPQPQQAQSNSVDDLTKQIQAGMSKYGSPPVATLSAELARAGQGLPDPLLPAIVALKETSGGKHLTYSNNWLNILGKKVNYDTPQGGINGEGAGKPGFQDTVHNGYYNDYLKSGDPADFYKHYTPDHDSKGKRNTNDPIPVQVEKHYQLRNLFL